MAGLARHVDPDEIIKTIHDNPRESHKRHLHTRGAITQNTPYSSRYSTQQEISKFKIPRDGAPADAVHQMLKDELDLDGKPNLNLASFVGTYMEREADALMMENISKNMSDADEYPAMMDMHARCVSIIAHLWGVQKGESAIGTATTGSSEAIHLGGLAMKRRWQEKRRAEGKDTSNPNIIMGANAQVALEKFARYFEVESRILPVSKKSNFRLDPDLVKENIDENTIGSDHECVRGLWLIYPGVFVILGSTYTGHYEPVEEISKILDDYEKKTGNDIPIHVDAASGGFIAPFTHAQVGGPKWNFELPRVKSINTSGHKFGLVYAGVGWIIWRDESMLPKHLVFELHYLGGTEESYTLNFSRPGAQIICQYFNLIHLGFNGFRSIMENCMTNARLLSKSLEASGWYTCVSDIHRKKGEHEFTGMTEDLSRKEGETSADYNAGLPVVAFRFSDAFKNDYPKLRQQSVSTLLRAKQYIIPNYPLPPGEDKTEILRVVVRESMSLDLLDRLISDIFAVTQTLMESDAVDLQAYAPGTNSVEKQHGSQGHDNRNRHKATRPMSHGVHRSHKSLDVITLFHKPSVPASTRVLTLLKQVSAEASDTATEDQATDHSHQKKIQRSEFELNVTEDPPTGDQLRTILEYVGARRAKDVVEGARNESDAMRMLKEDSKRFRRPVVVDWNNGRAVIGENESEILKMVGELTKETNV
ncbi:hypothetical protein MMC13_004815 [Lambiella insularis]|nr:hypothetical protein [Lambiella insularis]